MKFSFIMIRIYNSIACGIKLMNFQNTLTMSYDLLEFFSLWKKKKFGSFSSQSPCHTEN